MQKRNYQWGENMNRYPYNMPNPNMIPGVLPERTMPYQVSCIDPYVVNTLMTVIGKKLVVETVRGSMTGVLKDVKPDHIVLHEACGDSIFFIRIKEIVYIMPIGDK